MLTFDKEASIASPATTRRWLGLLEDVGFVQMEHRPPAFRSSRRKDLEINSDVRASESLVVEKGVPGEHSA
jgi:hypothetical protein